MGIFCQINLFKPSDNVYYPGSIVSGIIKYAVEKPTVFNKITVSLKGYGLVNIHLKRSKHGVDYKNKETYVDVDEVIENEKEIQHDIGMYERKFSFVLPHNVPSSIEYKREDRNWEGTIRIKCNIKYYIRIKFEKPDFFSLVKRFKKILNVECGVQPILPREPIIYGQQSKLFKPFSSKDQIVNIKAVIENSVITPGNKIAFEWELTNDTDLTVSGVTSKLIEVYTFKSESGKEYKMQSDVENTDSQTGRIQSGELQRFDFNIDVPLGLRSLGFSNIMSRDYIVKLKAVLPFPRYSVVLEIPVQIGEVIDEEAGEQRNNAEGFAKETCGSGSSEVPSGLNTFGEGPSNAPPPYEELGESLRNDLPPSYWEAMGEDSDDEDERSDRKS